MFPMIEYYPRCNCIEVHEIWDKPQSMDSFNIVAVEYTISHKTRL